MTTKYFKVTASIQKNVSIYVTATDEKTAKSKAIEEIKKQNSLFNVSFKDIALEYETKYKVGNKVKHFIFGEGEITQLKPATNANNDRLYSATIKFSNGEIQEIGLQMPKEKLEIIE